MVSAKCMDYTTVPVIQVSAMVAGSDGIQQNMQLDVTFARESCPRVLKAVDVVTELCKELPALRPLVMVVKQLLTEKKLNNTYSGGLCSYACVLTVAKHLQGVSRDAQSRPAMLLLSYLDSWNPRNQNHERDFSKEKEAIEAGSSDVASRMLGSSNEPKVEGQATGQTELVEKERDPQVCHYYNIKQGCRQHENCSYVHVCEAFVRGACKFGDRCFRAHTLDGTKWAQQGVQLEEIRLRDGSRVRAKHSKKKQSEVVSEPEATMSSTATTASNSGDGVLLVCDPTDEKNNVAQGCYRSIAVQKLMGNSKQALQKSCYEASILERECASETALCGLQEAILARLRGADPCVVEQSTKPKSCCLLSAIISVEKSGVDDDLITLVAEGTASPLGPVSKHR